MLTDRQSTILRAIIDTYQRTGEPAGSKYLKEHYRLSWSPATIRNHMVQLETLNLLTKRHASSGRVPTEAGYRYYLNYIVPTLGDRLEQSLDRATAARVHDVFQEPYLEMTEVIRRSTEALAELTHYVALALAPVDTDYHLAFYRFVPLDKRQVLIAIVTEEGVSESQIFHLSETISLTQMRAVIDECNRELAGQSLPEVLTALRHSMPSDASPPEQTVATKAMLAHLTTKMAHDRIDIYGRNAFSHYLIAHDDVEQAIQLNQFLDDPKTVFALMKTDAPGIQVRLGDEVDESSLRHMSIISELIRTTTPDKQITIALIGPQNMSYIRAVQLFQTVKCEIAHYLDHY